MLDWIIEDGDVLSPDGLAKDDLFLSGGFVTDAAPVSARRFSAKGCVVVPGIVDVHGDAFERVVSPRPNVSFDLEPSLHEVDRQLISNGITTAFHGLTASFEPGLRSFEAAGAFLDTLDRISGDMLSDMHVNLRWEVFCLDRDDQVIDWLSARPSLLLSLNDHLSAYRSLSADALKITRMADRTGLSPQACVDLTQTLWGRADEVPAAVEHITRSAVALGRTVFAHDETSPGIREMNRALGVTVSEFPMTKDTARNAIEANEAVVLGAPNVVRGGSQNNAVDAEPAIAEGLCTVLASDYYYPAPLLAVFALLTRHGMDLAQAWALVSSAPAQAAGLDDRGTLRVGKRADVIVVDPRAQRVRATFVAGRKVFECE